MRKLLPILIVLLGTAAGMATGYIFRPVPNPDEPPAPVDDNACVPAPTDNSHSLVATVPPTDSDAHDYVKMNNQFIVPVLMKGRVSSMVLITLSVEVAKGQKEAVFAREPKLRDAFLQVMFDHANIGGFAGAFTNSSNLNVLRSALLEVGQSALGPTVTDVLIMDIARQDT